MDAINERRLRPVYDFIDAGNYKRALQEVDKVLKKQKDFPCAKVLKALSLIKLNRGSEAESILTTVVQDCPTDETTLNAISSCYRELGKPNVVCEVYEKALTKDPTSEEILYNLFMSYIRIGDFKKQQLTSLNLYKLKGKNPYYFWNVMSLYLQAIEEKDKEKVLLTLAEKKIEKFALEKKIENEVEVELYLMILERQKKYQEMLNVIEGPLGRLLPNYIDFLTRRSAHLYELVGNKKKSLELFKKLLDSHPDSMEYHRKSIELAIVVDQDEESSKEVSRKNVRSIVDSIKRLTEKSNKKGKYRGPHLTKIELFYKLKELGWKEELNHLCTNAIDMFVDFFNLFAHKQAFYHDMSYLWTHVPLCRDDMKDSFKNHVEFGDMCESCKVEDNMKRQLSYMWTACMWREDDFRSKCLSLMVRCYDVSLPFGAHLPTSDINPSDPFAFLAAILRVSASNSTTKDTLASIILLTRVIEKSPSNHSIKLFLVMVLNHIGAVGLSVKIFESLDVKYIMHDSLLYVLYGCLFSSGYFNSFVEYIASLKKFYSVCSRDVVEFTISAVKYGTFSKVEEIQSLKERLSSIFKYTTHIDDVFNRIFYESSNTVSELKSTIESLINSNNDMSMLKEAIEHDREFPDNRDVRVFLNLTISLQEGLNEWRSWSYKCEKTWIRYRASLLLVLIAAHQRIHSNSNENVASNGTDYESSDVNRVVTKLHNLDLSDQHLYWISLERLPLPPTDRFIFGPWIPRIGWFWRSGHHETMKRLVGVLTSFVKHEGSEDFKLDGQVFESLQKSLEQLERSENVTDDCRDIKVFIEQSVNIYEVVSIACTIFGLMVPTKIVEKPGQQPSKKSSKKKGDRNESTAKTKIDVESWNATVLTLELICKKLKECITRESKTCSELRNVMSIEEWLSKFVISQITEEGNDAFDFVNVTDPHHKSIAEKIKKELYESYIESFESLNTHLSKKESFLSTLKI